MSTTTNPDPAEIASLMERFNKKQISHEEYATLLRALLDKAAPAAPTDPLNSLATIARNQHMTSELGSAEAATAYRQVGQLQDQATKLAGDTTIEDNYKRMFRDRVKNNAISEWEAIVVTYVLYGNEGDRNFLVVLLQTTTGHTRLQLHNMRVAMHYGDDEVFLKRHAKALLSLPWPLLPPITEFFAINQKMIDDWSEYLSKKDDNPSGGGPARPPKPPAIFGAKPISGGAPYLALAQVDGQTVVEAGPVAEVTNSLTSQVKQLQRELKNIRRERDYDYGRGGDQYRGRGGRGRGGRGGRGSYSDRYNGYHARGGQPEELDLPDDVEAVDPRAHDHRAQQPDTARKAEQGDATKPRRRGF